MRAQHDHGAVSSSSTSNSTLTKLAMEGRTSKSTMLGGDAWATSLCPIRRTVSSKTFTDLRAEKYVLTLFRVVAAAISELQFALICDG